jgi:hypothetical protein
MKKEELLALQASMKERTRVQKARRRLLVLIDTEMRHLKAKRRQLVATIEGEGTKQARRA